MIRHLLLAIVCLSVFALLSGCDSNAAKETPSADTEATVESTAGTSPPPVSGEAPADAETEFVATINGVPIARGVFEAQLGIAESSMMVFGDDAENEANLELKLEILNALINLELAYQDAQKKGYSLSDEELTAALDDFKSEFSDTEEMSKIIDLFGGTEEELRDQLSRALTIQKWQEATFQNEATVSDKEARTFYDEHPSMVQHNDMVLASQIFIGIPLGSPDPEKDGAKQEAENALKRLQSGEDFDQVAAEMSNDPGAAQSGGDLGWLEKGRLIPAFEETLFSLKPGQISPILESALGFHIFKISEIKPAGKEPFDNVKNDIVEFLSGSKLAEAVREKMTSLHNEATIEILDPALKKAYESAASEEELQQQ